MRRGLGLCPCGIFDLLMNAASIIILAVVVTLVVLALRAAFRRDAGSCSCGSCEKKDNCPYCSGGKNS